MVCIHHFYRFYKAAKVLAENKLSDGTGRKPLYRYTYFMEVVNWLRNIGIWLRGTACFSSPLSLFMFERFVLMCTVEYSATG